MSKKNNNEKIFQQQMFQNQQSDRALQERMLALMQQKNPLQERLEKDNLDILKWASGESGPIDAANMPGDKVGRALYDRALMRSEGTRSANGLMSLGESNPQHLGLLREMQDTERQRNAAGDLERYVTGRVASARGESPGLIGQDWAQRSGLGGLASNNAANSSNQYLQWMTRPKQPPLWRSFFKF